MATAPPNFFKSKAQNKGEQLKIETEECAIVSDMYERGGSRQVPKEAPELLVSKCREKKRKSTPEDRLT